MSFETRMSVPAPVLRPFVTTYAGFRACGLPPATLVGLPSRNVHLIISFRAPIEIVRMPSGAQRPAAYAALVSGLQEGPALIRQGPEAHGMHLFLTPLGARSILGVSSADLACRVVSLSDLWGLEGDRLVDRLSSAHTWQSRFDILDRALTARLKPLAAAPEIAHTWAQLTRAHGGLRIEELARRIGWSRRHFAERFRDTFGITPKSAARVFRFERACWLIRGRRSLADVAVACGYYDQAHMSHEWSALAGCSPQAWIADQLPFLQDYELAGSDAEVQELTS